jgi:DegV family protein with EDD domain
MRDGVTCQTSAVNTHEFIEAMEGVIKEGRDLLYLAFSSGLSATYQSGVLAVSELREKYPDRKIYIVDTLCASLGQGLFCTLCAEEKKKGKTIDELKDFAEATKLKVCHWFIVDDLNHLRRGGRISATTAIVGTMLNIKPVLHVDTRGISSKWARPGRQAALKKPLWTYGGKRGGAQKSAYFHQPRRLRGGRQIGCRF